MFMDAILGRFVEQSPMTVAVRSTLEYALDRDALDALFDHTIAHPKERQLLFSTCVDLMTTVVCRIKPSIHAAYQADDHISVSVSAVYKRLARVNTDAGRQLVRHTAQRLEPSFDNTVGPIPTCCPVTASKFSMATTWLAPKDGSNRYATWPLAHCRDTLWWSSIPSWGWHWMSSAARTPTPKNEPCLGRSWTRWLLVMCGWRTGTSARQAFSLGSPSGRGSS